MTRKNNKTWFFPLRSWDSEVPSGEHPGAFGARRKYDIHTGVDLYVPGPCSVYAVEAGTVVSVEDFTGPEAGSPWWLPTKAILVKGGTGVVCYGEVEPKVLRIGQKVRKGEVLGQVTPVLAEVTLRNDIPGHSRFMLHFELYSPQTVKTVWWRLNEACPSNLRNPTTFLAAATRKN